MISIDKMKRNKEETRKRFRQLRNEQKREFEIENFKDKKEIFNFELSLIERAAAIKILNQDLRSEEKKRFLKKIGKQFSETYIGYRKAIQLSKGNSCCFVISKKSQSLSERAAELCIRYGLTPKDIIVYWHKNMRNFCDGKMKLPALSFLSSKYAVETVAERNEGSKQIASEFGNAFENLSDLDPAIRKVLKKSGFEIVAGDWFLLEVQTAARAKIKLKDYYVSKEIRPLVDCVVKYYENKKSD